MTLREWVRNGWLVEHKTGPREICDVLAAISRDLRDCKASGLSPDWQLNIAYNAALQAAAAALAAAGYRAARDSHHFHVIQSLAHTIGAAPSLVAQFDAFRKKRNIGTYERAGMVSDQEAKEMYGLAARLRSDVRGWLEANHPELLEEWHRTLERDGGSSTAPSGEE